MEPLSAGELLAALRRARSLSPVEVVAELSAAIEADPHGAFWATCLERAAEEARAAEAAWARGDARPLEGVPIAVKDIFDTEGVETTYGSAMFRGHVPERDAEAVRRVRAAGAIVLGKTATHEFAWGFSSINDALGTVRNPRDPERVAGGSSGGSGAALAAGLAPLALGTDTGGSIRVPSAFCEVLRAQADVRAREPRRRLAAGAHARPRGPDGAHARATSRCCSACSRRCRAHVAPAPRARRRLPRPARRPARAAARRRARRAGALRLGAGEVALPGGGADRARVPHDPARRGPRDAPRAPGSGPTRADEYGADVRRRVEMGARGHAAGAARRPRRPRDGPRRLRRACSSTPTCCSRPPCRSRRRGSRTSGRTRRCATRCSPTPRRRTSSGCRRACCRTACSSPGRRAPRRCCCPSPRRSCRTSFVLDERRSTVEWRSCRARSPSHLGAAGGRARRPARDAAHPRPDRRRGAARSSTPAASTPSACASVAEALGHRPGVAVRPRPGKDELLSLLIERLAGEVQLPEPDPERWQEQIKDSCARCTPSCSRTATWRERALGTSRSARRPCVPTA